MDILIKSFNRPYYLDRCLCSIQKHLSNFGNIYVLDDGTPIEYLDKIQELYPSVKILKSNLHHIKSNTIDDLSEFVIPIDFWLKSAKLASEYFLLLEDDFWVTDDLDLSELELGLEQEHMVFLKLLWFGNPKLTTDRIKKRHCLFNIITFKLLTHLPWLFNLVFRVHKYKLDYLMRILRLNTFSNLLPYYNIYTVAGAVFKRDYFTYLWSGHSDIVDETLQILNALKYFKKFPEANVAHSTKEYLKTGFSSSATFGAHNNFRNKPLLKVNNVLNRSWLKGKFSTIKNMPNDLCEEDIISVLINDREGEKLVGNWKKWKANFKKQYQEFGCKTE